MLKILVTTDFSKNAFKAIACAAEIARNSHSEIHLLHVIEPALNLATLQTDSQNKKVVEECKKKLQQTINSAKSVYPEVKLIPYLSGGKVVNSILQYADEKKIDLIIMGTKGAGGLKEFFAGTNTAGVIGKSKVPVLSVPVSSQLGEPKKIMFTTNQFEKNRKLLDRAMLLPEMFASEVHVIVFKESGKDKNAELIYNNEQLNDYISYLSGLFPDISLKGELLEGDDFELAIDNYCADIGCDIIIMITYPKTFFEKIFRKSITKKMAFHSTRPILAIPAFSHYHNNL